MKRHILLAAMLMTGLAAVVACGGRSGKGGEAAKTAEEQTVAPAEAETAVNATKQEAPKKEVKKWYEQDFSLTYKQYILTTSLTRTYARKGNVVVSKSADSPAVNLMVFTDSTRTDYIVNPENGKYGKLREKTGLSGMDAGIKKYLKDQMGDNVFIGVLKPDGENCTAKDTVIFGRPAYVITQEKKESTLGIEMYTKIIEWVDRENGLPYYKYGFGKSGDKVVANGKAFEITDFSAEPTYEGLVMSLEGLTEVEK